MPCYLYRCDNEECEHTFDEVHSIQLNRAGDPCSVCGSGSLKRIVSAVPFKFATEMPRVHKGENLR
jgi:putative FmdB family regulatory protein